MSELGTLLRDHIEAAAPPLDVDRLIDQFERELRPGAPRRRPRWAVALAAAVIVVLVVGAVAFLLRAVEEEPVIEEPSPTTTTIPESSPAVINPVSEAGQAGSVYVGPDGLPVITALSAAGAEPPQAVVIRKCLDPECSALSEPVIFGEWLYGAAVAVGPEGLPVLAYTNLEATDQPGDLTLVTCQTADCAQFTSTVFGTSVGLLALDSARLPVVLRGDPSGFLLTRCADIACRGIASEAAIPAPSRVDAESLVIGPDDRPAVLYVALEEQVELYVARCADPACGEVTVSLVATDELPRGGGESPFRHSLTLDEQGVPIVAFGYRQLQVVRCENPDCTGAPTVTRVGESLRIGSIDVAYSAGGLPIIGYSGIVSPGVGEVRLASCADPICATGTIATVLEVESPEVEAPPRVSMAFLPNGRPVLVSEAEIVVCGDPDCSEAAISETAWDQTPTPTTTLPPLGETIGGWMRVPHDPEIFGFFGGMNAVHATAEELLAGGTICADVNTEACQPTVWTSSDGLRWSQTRLDEDGEVSGIASTPDGLVAVGSSGADPAIWVSADGETWTMVATDPEVFRGCSTWEDFPPEEQCETGIDAVVARGSTALAVGWDAGGPVIWRSENLVDWQRAGLPDLSDALAFDVQTLDALPAGFVALSGYRDPESAWEVAVFSSPDGASWDRVTGSQELFPDGEYPYYLLHSAARWNDGLLAFLETCDEDWNCSFVALVTPEGNDWSLLPLDPDVFLSGDAGPGTVTSLGSGLVATGAHFDEFGEYVSNLMWISEDGIIWELKELDPALFPEFSGIDDMVEFGGRLVGVGGLGPDGPAIWIYDPSVQGG